VTGDAPTIGDAVLNDPRVRKLSFTGSTEVGRLLMAKASNRVLRLSLELGGHAPFIVFDDADVEKAVAAAMANKFRNAGQTCICANRFYVQAKIYDAFVKRFAAAMRSLTVGEGTRDGVQIGPLINDDAMAKVEQHVADAQARGGAIAVGGARVALKGLANRFYAPTLIENVSPEMLASREETFGPVAPIRKFADEREAIEWANDSEYGLAAYFFTQSASRIWRVAEALEYGVVGVNDATPSTAQAPFGGVKQSGLGREGGRYAMDEYTELKFISWGL
jgi:succinate-semialdehyde dehydrogenase/glutarate-semialdehyde dehydrogenase